MKPARGSARKSTQGPGGKGKAGARKENIPTASESPSPSAAAAKQKQPKQQAAKKRKTVSSGPQGVRVRGQEKWTPPPQPLLSALDRMLNLSLLSVLSMKLRDKEETQKHLNILKERFLHSCGVLPVPPGKKNKLASWKHQEETQKTEEGKKKLTTLEENQRMVVSSLEELEVTKERLDEENRITRSRVEEEEDNAHQVLLQRDQAVLHLPALPSRSHTDHQTLQERLMEAVPDVGGAMKALRNLPELRPVSSYIELANQHAQLRVTTATTTNTQHT